MSGLFAFRCWMPQHPLCSSSLIVFSGPNNFSYNDLITVISEETKKALSPEILYLIFPNTEINSIIKRTAENDAAFAPLSKDTIIGIYGYDGKGDIKFCKSIRGRAPRSVSVDNIKRQGLTTLFRRRVGLLEAGPTAYFVKPSGKPDSRFLRASHALSEGAEIFFTAFWLLPLFDDDVQYVHLDTSSIASVITAALLMKKQRNMPTIRTFQSYEGMYTHPFSVDRSDLVLISASQSGSMAKYISDKIADKKRVVTLFSTYDAFSGTTVLCDLRYDTIKNELGYLPPRIIDRIKESRPIKLISEHFVAEPEPARSILPRLKHVPTVVKTTIAQLQGLNVFVAYRAGASSDGRRAVWVDVEKLKETKPFCDWVDRIVVSQIPATTRAIIYTKRDISSKILGDEIIRRIELHGGSLQGVAMLSLEEIEAGEKEWPQASSPVVVTGGATGHGAELLAVSRALRRYAADSHRIFLSMASMPSSKRAFDLLDSNLRQPDHIFKSMFSVFIDREGATHSWEDERNYLIRFESELTPSLEERLQTLEKSTGGLLDNLFLPGWDGTLKLRNNFAFWPDQIDCSKATQADVFLTIAAILENMRSGPELKIEDRLMNDVQNHTVLSVEAFSRYNDGIIQAAILRASLPIELNYKDAPEHSRLMFDFIGQMVDLVNRPQGEALNEFLLAIILRKINLIDKDLRKLHKVLEKKVAILKGDTEWLARRIISDFREE